MQEHQPDLNVDRSSEVETSNQILFFDICDFAVHSKNLQQLRAMFAKESKLHQKLAWVLSSFSISSEEVHRCGHNIYCHRAPPDTLGIRLQVLFTPQN